MITNIYEGETKYVIMNVNYYSEIYEKENFRWEYLII